MDENAGIKENGKEQGMVRYAIWLSFIVGSLTPTYLDVLPQASHLLFLMALLLFFWRKIFFQILLVFLLGFLINTWQLTTVIKQQLSESLEGEDLLLIGKIVSLPVRKSDRVRFDLLVEGVVSEHRESLRIKGRKIRLSWYLKDDKNKVEPGQTWKLLVRLKRPRGLVNPGGFDYQAWLLKDGVSATGYIKNRGELLASANTPLFHRLRFLLSERLFDTEAPSVQSLSKALLIGDKSPISPSQWQVLNRTGTTHLMAISGLHIGLIAAFAFFITRKALPLLMCISSPLLMRFIPALCSTGASTIYAGLAGFSIPTQRAWIIVCLLNVAYLGAKKTSPIHMLTVAAALVSILDPFAALQHGFWLSFGAVLCLVYCFAARVKKTSKIWGLILAQVVVFVGLSVLLLGRQLPLSVVAPLANLVAVPTISILVVPMLFIAAVLSLAHSGLAQIVLALNHTVLEILWMCLEFLSQQDFTWSTNKINAPRGLLMGVVACTLILSPWVLNLRLPGVCLLMLIFASDKDSDGSIVITILDVGQGLSVMVRNNEYAVVYDVGARFSQDFDIGSRVVVPFLRYQGIEQADLVVVSHGDNDHAGGLSGLMNNFPVLQVATNPIKQFVEVNAEYRPCLAGQAWHYPDFTLDVLWPEGQSLGSHNSNNNSCVILLRSENFSMLFTGDIEKRVERALLAKGVLPSGINVLIAPHHGSRTSSSPALVEHLAPEHVIFSTGFNNPYRHPAQEVVERYKNIGSRQWNTAVDGAITLTVNQSGRFGIIAERQRQIKPWHKSGEL